MTKAKVQSYVLAMVVLALNWFVLLKTCHVTVCFISKAKHIQNSFCRKEQNGTLQILPIHHLDCVGLGPTHPSQFHHISNNLHTPFHSVAQTEKSAHKRLALAYLIKCASIYTKLISTFQWKNKNVRRNCSVTRWINYFFNIWPFRRLKMCPMS